MHSYIKKGKGSGETLTGSMLTSHLPKQNFNREYLRLINQEIAHNHVI